MTTRALEDQEIEAIFENIRGAHAKRNEIVSLIVDIEYTVINGNTG